MNPKSIILLLVIVAVVLFMLGVNLGKQIELVDKTHPFVTPTIIIRPTTTPIPLTFKTFTSKSCGVSFLYPEVLQDNSSSTSAELSNNTDVVKVTCDKKAISDFEKMKVNYDKGSDLIVNTVKTSIFDVNKHQIFEIANPINGRTILFETSPNLSDLVAKSIEFGK